MRDSVQDVTAEITTLASTGFLRRHREEQTAGAPPTHPSPMCGGKNRTQASFAQCHQGGLNQKIKFCLFSWFKKLKWKLILPCSQRCQTHSTKKVVLTNSVIFSQPCGLHTQDVFVYVAVPCTTDVRSSKTATPGAWLHSTSTTDWLWFCHPQNGQMLPAAHWLNISDAVMAWSWTSFTFGSSSWKVYECMVTKCMIRPLLKLKKKKRESKREWEKERKKENEREREGRKEGGKERRKGGKEVRKKEKKEGKEGKEGEEGRTEKRKEGRKGGKEGREKGNRGPNKKRGMKEVYRQ